MFSLLFPLCILIGEPALAKDQQGTQGKDPSTALTLALAMTIGPTALGWYGLSFLPGIPGPKEKTLGSGGAVLFASGLLVGPSAGHIYAGEYRHAVGFSLLRLVSLAPVSLALYEASREKDEGGIGMAVLSLAGIAVWGGLTGFDWLDAPRAVHRRQGKVSNLAFSPVISPDEHYRALGIRAVF